MNRWISLGIASIAGGLAFSAISLGAPFETRTLAQSGSQSCPSTATSYRNRKGQTVTCMCPGSATTRGTVWGTDTYTDDSRICRAALHAGVIGSNGGQVTFELLAGRSSYTGSTRNGVTTLRYGAWQHSMRFRQGARSSSSASSSAQSGGSGGELVSIWNSAGCSFTDESPLALARASRVDRMVIWYNWPQGQTSSSYELVGPNGAVVRRGTLSRNSCDTYQQSWCEGVDRPGVSLPAGQYRIRVPNGRICRNAQSGQRGFIRAYGVPIAAAPAAASVGNCPGNLRGRRGTLTCNCTASATRSGSVWGTDIYTDDSKICRAAVHAGVIGASGGVVTVSWMSGRSSYTGSTRNGISTTRYGNWNGSYRFVR